MQFLTALVEHLVVGVVALLWLLPTASSFNLLPCLVDLDKHKEILLAVGVPIAYVVGMYIDVIASLFFLPVRRFLNFGDKKWRERFFGSHLGSASGVAYDKSAKILIHSPDEAARYMLQLSSREKIARGVALNFLLAAVANIYLPPSNFSISASIMFGLGIFGFFVWLRLNALTDIYKSNLVSGISVNLRLAKRFKK